MLHRDRRTDLLLEVTLAVSHVTSPKNKGSSEFKKVPGFQQSTFGFILREWPMSACPDTVGAFFDSILPVY